MYRFKTVYVSQYIGGDISSLSYQGSRWGFMEYNRETIQFGRGVRVWDNR